MHPVNDIRHDTWWAEESRRAEHSIINVHHPSTVVTVVARWTQVTGGLACLRLVPATGTQDGVVSVLWAVVALGTWVVVRHHLSLRAVVARTAIT